MCNEDPAAYIRIVPSLLPKEIQLPGGDALSNVPDDKLAELIDVLTNIVNNNGKLGPEPAPKERVVN